jgi:hypothetical protein
MTIIKLGIVADKSIPRTIGHITLNKKLLRKRSAGNPHAAFEAAGAGNVNHGSRTEVYLAKAVG